MRKFNFRRVNMKFCASWSHAGKVLTHDFILREIWGSDANARYLRIYIRALRQKIEVDPKRPTHILTVTRVGYRLRKSD